MKVFLTYDRSDETLARAITAGLSAEGFDVWSARDEVFPGDNYHLMVGKALEASDAMVVLLSPASVKSEEMRSEISYALGAINYKDRVIPVLARPTRKIPWILKRFDPIPADEDGVEASRQVADRLRGAGVAG